MNDSFIATKGIVVIKKMIDGLYKVIVGGIKMRNKAAYSES